MGFTRRFAGGKAEAVAGGMLPIRIFAGAGLFPLGKGNCFLNIFVWKISGFRPIFVENRFVYPENEIVLVAEK